MKRSFGQFKKAVKERKDLNLSPVERAIVKAFSQGESAGRADEPRRPPYMPTSERDKFEAWLAGYDEQATRYVLAQVDRNPEGEKPQALSAEHGLMSPKAMRPTLLLSHPT